MQKKYFKSRLLILVLILTMVMSTGTLNVFAEDSIQADTNVTGETQDVVTTENPTNDSVNNTEDVIENETTANDENGALQPGEQPSADPEKTPAAPKPMAKGPMMGAPLATIAEDVVDNPVVEIEVDADGNIITDYYDALVKLTKETTALTIYYKKTVKIPLVGNQETWVVLDNDFISKLPSTPDETKTIQIGYGVGIPTPQHTIEVTFVAKAARTESKIVLKDANEFKVYIDEDGQTQKEDFLKGIDFENCIPTEMDLAELKVEYSRTGVLWTELSSDNPIKTTDFIDDIWNPEYKFRVTYPGNVEYLPTTSEIITLSLLVKPKLPSKLVFNDINVTYNTDAAVQKQQIFEAINWDESTLPEDFSIDDLTVMYKYELNIPGINIDLPSIPGLNLDFTELKGENVIPAGEQTITVSYAGNDEYKSFNSGELKINVAKANVNSFNVNSQTINYGETFNDFVTVDPRKVSYLTIIAGVDTAINPFVSVYIPKTGDPVLDYVFDEAIKLIPEDGIDLKGFLNILQSGTDFAGALGVDVNTIQQIIDNLPEGVGNLTIQINKPPTEAGLYSVVALTVDPNYETAFGAGYLVINMDTNGKLSWNDPQLPLNLNPNEEYDFSAKSTIEDADIKYQFFGFNSDGKFLTNTSPIMDSGIYTEVAYLYLGSEYAAPIARKYVVGRIGTICKKQNAEKTYDGQPFDENEIFQIVDADGNVIDNPKCELLYINKKTLLPCKSKPTDVGEYLVKGIYCGDKLHEPTVVCASFTIKPVEVCVEIQDVTKVYGEPDPVFTYIVKDANGKVNIKLNFKQLSRAAGEDVGEYEINGVVGNSCGVQNYKVTEVLPGTLTITKRPITVNIDNKAKAKGQEDPEFTYQIVDGNLVFDDTMTINLTRAEGEEIGKYIIYPIATLISKNYDLTVNNGRLTIYGLDQLFTVTYTDGVENEEVFVDQVHKNIKAETPTPAFEGTPTREGYEFTGWTPEFSDTVTGDVTYTATWTPVGGGSTGGGNTGGNGGSTVSHYTVTYTDGVDGEVIFADQIKGGLIYGTDTPAFDGTPERVGYKFVGWDPEVATKVTGNAVYTARWEKVDEEVVGPTNPTDPGNGGEIDRPSKPEKPNKPAKPGTSHKTDNATTANTDEPKTSDTHNLVGWTALLITALAALGVSITAFRRKEEK